MKTDQANLAAVNAELAAAFGKTSLTVVWGAFAPSRTKPRATGAAAPHHPRAGQSAA